MLAFMMIACMLSMWISNSAVTAMLLPIVRSILHEIFDSVRKLKKILCDRYNSFKSVQESAMENGFSSSGSVESVAANSVSDFPLVVVKQTNEDEAKRWLEIKLIVKKNWIN